MKTKTTKAEKLRASCISVAQHIQTATGISIDQYHNHLFETGCVFLDSQYPAELGYQAYYERVAYDEKFWRFFTLEFRAFNKHLINLLQEDLSLTVWLAEIEAWPQNEKLYHNFYSNYIKYINHRI